MGKVISFEDRLKKKVAESPSRIDQQAHLMLKVADEIDGVILRHVAKNLDVRDIAGLLAHRLGALMAHIEEDARGPLMVVIKKILTSQANIENASDF